MTQFPSPADSAPFAELPAALVDEVLGQTSAVARELLDSFRQVREERAALRGKLEGSGALIADSSLGYPPAPTTCAAGRFIRHRAASHDGSGRGCRGGGRGSDTAIREAALGTPSSQELRCRRASLPGYRHRSPVGNVGRGVVSGHRGSARFVDAGRHVDVAHHLLQSGPQHGA